MTNRRMTNGEWHESWMLHDPAMCVIRNDSTFNYAVFTQQRNTSATLQACAMQPPAMCGSRASNTSLIVPMPLSLRCYGKRSRNFARSAFVVRMNFQPGIDKRPDQPGPDRALMISAIARAQVAGVNRFVFRIVRRKRTQSDRREQFASARPRRPMPSAASSRTG